MLEEMASGRKLTSSGGTVGSSQPSQHASQLGRCFAIRCCHRKVSLRKGKDPARLYEFLADEKHYDLPTGGMSGMFRSNRHSGYGADDDSDSGSEGRRMRRRSHHSRKSSVKRRADKLTGKATEWAVEWAIWA